jgi:RNA polymerase sigma factor (sigma-70 family)
MQPPHNSNLWPLVRYSTPEARKQRVATGWTSCFHFDIRYSVFNIRYSPCLFWINLHAPPTNNVWIMTADSGMVSAWLTRAAAGDDEAFGRLAGAVQDDLFRFALAQGLRRADAAEAVQETLLRAYRHRGRYRKDGNAMGWLIGIAMNVARETRRRLGRGAQTGLDPALLADRGGKPGAALEDEEMLAVLAQAIGRLPPRQREAVTCRRLLQLSVRDTAEVMGCAEGTVKAALFAAMEGLKKMMRPEA